MSESTIDLRPDFGNNNSNQYNPMHEREQMQNMNNIAVQLAMGMQLQKSMDNKLTSVNMNMGKVAAGLNRLDVTMTTLTNINKDMGNKMSAINMNIGKSNVRLDKIDAGIQQMVQIFKTGQGNKNTNMSIGHMSTRLASMQKHQEETNKLLSQIFQTRRTGGSTKYEKLEADFESRSGEKVGDMSKTLVSIDNTLKAILARGGGGMGGGGGSVVDTVKDVTKAGFWATVGSQAKNLFNGFRSMMAAGSASLAGSAVPGLASSIAVPAAAATTLGWGSLRRPNEEQMAYIERAKKEYHEKQSAEWASRQDATKGPVWERKGRQPFHAFHMAQAAKDHEAAMAARPFKEYGTAIGPGLQLMMGNIGGTQTTTANDPNENYSVRPSGMNVTPNVYQTNPYSSSGLVAQNQQTEMRDKGITTGDMIYNAKDITYKATMIRFDAGTIMFGGGQGGGTSSGNSGDAPQINGGTPQNYPAYQGGPTSDVLSSPSRTEPSMSGGSGGTYKAGNNTGKMNSTSKGAMETVINTLMAGDPKLGLKGMTRQEAELFTANFYSENKSFGTDPNQIGDKNIPGGSHGIGQWNRDRLDGLKSFAKSNGMDWQDPKTQALWTLQETQKGGKKDFYKKFSEAVAKGDVAGAYGLLRDKYEVGLKGGSNLENFNKGLDIVRGGSYDSVGGTGTGKRAKINEMYGPKRPGKVNDGIANIAALAGGAAGMEEVNFTSGRGTWNSSWIKKGGKTMHGTGNAVDVTGFENHAQKLEFIEEAVAQGANGIGVYNNGSVHIDTGKFRQWAGATAKDVQQAIARGKARRGKSAQTPEMAEVEKLAPSTVRPRPKPEGLGQSARQFPTGGGMSYTPALPTVSADKVSEVSPKSDWWGNYGLDDEEESSAGKSDMMKKAVSRNYEAGRNAIAAKRRKLLEQSQERAEMARRSRDNTERARTSSNEKNSGPATSTQKADEKKDMHSALNRHSDWYKQFAAQIRA